MVKGLAEAGKRVFDVCSAPERKLKRQRRVSRVLHSALPRSLKR